MRRLVYVCSIGAVLATASPALAKDPPVFVDPDPDSPAGAEYAIPLDRARDEADGNSKRSTGSAPLFGEGISRSGEAVGAQGGSGGSGGSGTGGSASDSSGGSGSGSGAGAKVSVPAASDTAGASTGPTILIPLAVLALAGGVALLVARLRSRSRRPSPD